MEITKKLLNEDGLHARPAGIFAKAASAFQSKIEIVFQGRTVNAKSSMSLMTLGLAKDSEFVLKAEGSDADAALASLGQLIDNKLQIG